VEIDPPNASNPMTAVTYFFLFLSTLLIVTRLAIFRFTSASSFAAAFFSFFAVSASSAEAAVRERAAAFAVRASVMVVVA
jgi:Ni,Fe-hydrogenase I cytochrome b subunit